MPQEIKADDIISTEVLERVDLLIDKLRIAIAHQEKLNMLMEQGKKLSSDPNN